MITQSNVTHMLVGKDLDILANTGTREDLAVGQIGVFKVGSETAVGTAALTSGDRYSIAFKKSDGYVIETPVATFGNETSKNAKLYSAPTQESTAIGFNGTNGSIEVANSTNYVAHVFWKDNSKTYGGHGQPVKFSAYYSSSSATELEIASGLAENFNKNFSRENPRILKAEVLSEAAGAAMTGTGTLTVKYGSRYATAGTDVDAVITVGDYVRIGGTATTDPVYQVVELDTTNNIMKFHMAYQGASATVAEANTEVVTAAAGAAASAGVQITALATTDDFQAGVIRYDVTNFDVELGSAFGSTDYTILSTPSTGSGTYWEVAQNEWFLKGNRGETWRVGSYPKENNLEATSGKTYDQITVEYAQPNSKTIDRDVIAYGAVLIATEDASVGDIHNQLKTVLGIS